MENSDADIGLAHRLRAEREARGWTLADLAARSGVSRAMVSKVERGEASPTAVLLGRLSAAFGLTMSELFARVEGDNGWLSRVADQPAWRDPETGFVRRSLTPPGGAPLELVWGDLPPGADIAYPAASYSFMAEHQIVMIEGVLTLTHGGTEYELTPGDCLRFGPPRDVVYRNRGEGRCRYIVAVLRAAREG